MAVTTIDGVKTLQIRNAKNGDFDLNLAGGGGGSSEEMMEIWLTFNTQTYSYDISDFDGKGITLPDDGFKAIVHLTNADESTQDIIANGYYLFADRGGIRYIIPLSWYEDGSIRIYVDSDGVAESAEKINDRISFAYLDSEFTLADNEVKPIYLAPVLMSGNQEDLIADIFHGEESGFIVIGDFGLFKGLSNVWLISTTYEETIASNQEIIKIKGILDY